MDDENLPQPIDQTVPSTPAHSEPPITETSGEAELAQHMELLSEGDESAVSTESAEQLDTISGGANPQGEPPSDELDDTLPLNVNAEARINDTIISRDKLLSQEQKLVKLDRLLLHLLKKLTQQHFHFQIEFYHFLLKHLFLKVSKNFHFYLSLEYLYYFQFYFVQLDFV